MKHRLARWVDRTLFDDSGREHPVEDCEDIFRPLVAGCLIVIAVIVVLAVVMLLSTGAAH